MQKDSYPTDWSKLSENAAVELVGSGVAEDGRQYFDLKLTYGSAEEMQRATRPADHSIVSTADLQPTEGSATWVAEIPPKG